MIAFGPLDLFSKALVFGAVTIRIPSELKFDATLSGSQSWNMYGIFGWSLKKLFFLYIYRAESSTSELWMESEMKKKFLVLPAVCNLVLVTTDLYMIFPHSLIQILIDAYILWQFRAESFTSKLWLKLNGKKILRPAMSADWAGPKKFYISLLVAIDLYMIQTHGTLQLLLFFYHLKIF